MNHAAHTLFSAFPLSPFALLTLSPSLSPLSVLILAALFFVTSVVGVVTGSNSMITVPAMFLLGIDPRVAVATNMFGLTFMSTGGALPFVGKGTIDRARLPALAVLTLVGSALGALLVLVVSSRAMPLVISVAMLAVTVFSVASRERGVVAATTGPTRAGELSAYGATFLLGIYGGFFSGGYVTLLTAVFVALFRMTFVEAVSTTKVVNVCSSLVATLIFMANGLVDYRLGLLLAVVMFAGAFVGARLALRLNNVWLRRVFLSTVAALALKILFYDFLWKGMMK